MQRLHDYVQTQEHRISQLEKSVIELTKKLQQDRTKTPISVGTIEYKFDQLKVETLEGTLNIGLNPADLEGIDELSVHNDTTMNHAKHSSRVATDIKETLLQYLNQELPNFIHDTKTNLQLELPDTYIDFIKKDIEKQVPNRINYYLNQELRSNNSHANTHTNKKEQIISLVKQDIQTAVYTFLNNFPVQMEGDKQS